MTLPPRAFYPALLPAMSKAGRNSSPSSRSAPSHGGLRLDARLHGRIDPSDVLQDAYLHAARALPAYLQHPEVPFYVWLRRLAGHRLGRLHREHLGAKMRAAGREVSLDRGPPTASSEAMAARLLGRAPRPSEEAVRLELIRRVQDALNDMEPMDREVLALRHFEQLSRAEAALVLDISEAAVAKRYLRHSPDSKRSWNTIPVVWRGCGHDAEIRNRSTRPVSR